MSGSLQIGPLAVPFSLLLVLGAAAAAMYVGKRLAKTGAAEVENMVWQTLLAGLVVARLVFVWHFRAAYLSTPLGILDIRDGGWSPMAGFAGAALFALVRQLRRPDLRKPLLSAFATGAVIWVAGTVAVSIQTGTSQKLPALGLLTLEGTPVKLADFRGKPTVVNLWATWCPPCVREMPVLQKAQVDHPSVNFVFINSGESPQRVAAWLESRKLLLKNVLLDSHGAAAAQFRQRGLPTTLFFDEKGELVSARTGELSAATLNERLQTLSR